MLAGNKCMSNNNPTPLLLLVFSRTSSPSPHVPANYPPTNHLSSSMFFYSLSVVYCIPIFLHTLQVLVFIHRLSGHRTSPPRRRGWHTVSVGGNNDDYAQINHPLLRIINCCRAEFSLFFINWAVCVLCTASWVGSLLLLLLLTDWVLPMNYLCLCDFYANRLWFGRRM